MPFFRRPSKTQQPSPLTAPQPYRDYSLRQPDRGAPLVSETTMMSLPPFYAAMRVLATSVMTLPVQDAEGRAIDLNPETGTHLLAHPTAHDTPASFFDSIMWSLMIHGNAFVVPTRVSMATGEITETEVVHPENVVPLWNRAGTYQSFDVGMWLDGEQLGPQDFIQIKEVTIGGFSWGVSKLRLLSHAVALQLSEQAHVKATWDEGAQPNGYFTRRGQVDPDVAQETADQLAATLGGRGNALAVLPDDTQWHQVTMSHADVQMLESRQWSTTVAASIIGVPPHLIGAATYDSETYSNVRHDAALMEATTISRYRVLIEQAFAQHSIFFKLGPAELAQPPLLERVQAMAAATQAGLCSPAQACEMLGWQPPDGDAADDRLRAMMAAAEASAAEEAAASDTDEEMADV